VSQPVDNAADTGYGPTLITSSLTGNPVVAYGQYDSGADSYGLYMSKATNMAGSAWSGGFAIDTSQDVGGFNSAVLRDGKMCIFTVKNADKISANRVCIYESMDATGIGWADPIELIPGVLHDYLRGLDASVIGGNPACSFVAQAEQTYLHFARVQGEGNFMVAIPAANADGSSLMVIDGRPAIATGAGQGNSKVDLRQADEANGVFWGEPQAISDPGLGGPPSMAFVNGLPTIAWVSGNRVYLRTAADAEANSWGPARLIHSDANGLTGKCTLVDCFGHPVICFSRPFGGELLALWLAD
jgi:hypothetical protein